MTHHTRPHNRQRHRFNSGRIIDNIFIVLAGVFTLAAITIIITAQAAR